MLRRLLARPDSPTLPLSHAPSLPLSLVRQVLHEKNIGGSERRKRAIAIYELGRIFKNYKNDEEIKACPDAASLIADIEKAMRNVLAAQGDDGDDRRDAA